VARCTSCGGDERLQAYAEGTLGPLLEHDARHSVDLTDVLTAYCRCGGSRSAAATAVRLSRAALHDRIERIERQLDVDLSDPDAVAGYHVAMLADARCGDPRAPEPPPGHARACGQPATWFVSPGGCQDDRVTRPLFRARLTTRRDRSSP
jgi:hypothetical protein